MWDYKQTCKFLPSLALAILVVNMNIFFSPGKMKIVVLN